MLLQNFDFQLDDPSYQLRMEQSLAIKPLGLKMRATLREGINATSLEKTLNVPVVRAANGHVKESTVQAAGPEQAATPMTILYGSNTGTCETFARRLAMTVSGHGFSASVTDMDAVSGKLPKDEPLIVGTASYEGQPPDNASHFIEWIQSIEGQALQNTKYAVFGCGHST